VHSRAKSHLKRSFFGSRLRRAKQSRFIPQTWCHLAWLCATRVHRSRLTVNDSECISALLRKPLCRTFVRSFIRSLGRPLFGRPQHLFVDSRRHTKMRIILCFEVTRNSHPRNANYVRSYERICTYGIPNNVPLYAYRRK